MAIGTGPAAGSCGPARRKAAGLDPAGRTGCGKVDPTGQPYVGPAGVSAGVGTIGICCGICTGCCWG